jgi:hypothetical protein
MVSSFLSKKRSSRFTASIIAVICIAVLVSAMAVVVGGCGKASLVGKWQDPSDNSITEFKADGTVAATDLAGVQATYKDEGGTVTVTVAGTVALTFTYTINGDTMVVTDSSTNESTTLTRVK